MQAMTLLSTEYRIISKDTRRLRVVGQALKMPWWNAYFQLDQDIVGHLNVPTDKNLNDWGRTNLEARRLFAHI